LGESFDFGQMQVVWELPEEKKKQKTGHKADYWERQALKKKKEKKKGKKGTSADQEIIVKRLQHRTRGKVPRRKNFGSKKKRKKIEEGKKESIPDWGGRREAGHAVHARSPRQSIKETSGMKTGRES